MTGHASRSSRPLAGIKVIDLTQAIAGPMCSQTLADMGADVVKVEPLAGEHGRVWGSWRDEGRSFMFFAANRNKRSIALDMGGPEGREVLDKLVAAADVLLISMSVEAMEKHDLTYEHFARIQPTLVFCSITGYGLGTERQYERAYDQMLQAETGIMAMNLHGEVPGRLPISAIDVLAANAAATAICAELARQPRTGAHLDSSLYAAAINLLSYWVPEVSVTGRSPSPDATKFTLSAPMGVYHSSDGYFTIGVGTQRLWQRLCDLLDLSDLVDDERFADNTARVANRGDLDRELHAEFEKMTTDECVARLKSAGIPCATVADVHGAVTSGFARDNHFVIAADDVDGLVAPGPIVRNLQLPLERADRTAPLLGEHTVEVLAEIGLSNDVDRLATAGVINLPPGMPSPRPAGPIGRSTRP